MKAILTSDWHFNASNRLSDFRDSALRLANTAAQDPDVSDFVILGDVYNTFSPSTVEREAFYSAVSPLIKAGKRITIVLGNHDVNDKCLGYTQHSVSEFSALVPGVKVVSAPEVITLCGKRALCMPHLSKNFLDNRAYCDVFFGAIKDSGSIDMVLSHVLIWDAIGSFGEPSDRGISSSDLLDKVKVPFIAGDIHTNTVLRDNPLVAYTGSLDTVTFGEITHKRGYYTYDSATGEFSWNTIASKVFTDIVVDVDTKTCHVVSSNHGKSDYNLCVSDVLTESITKTLQRPSSFVSGSILKLRITGHKNVVDRLDRSEVLACVQRLNPDSVAGINFNYTDNTLVRSSEFKTHMDPSEAFKLWVGTQKYDNDLIRDSVMATGLEALRNAPN